MSRKTSPQGRSARKRPELHKTQDTSRLVIAQANQRAERVKTDAQEKPTRPGTMILAVFLAQGSIILLAVALTLAAYLITGASLGGVLPGAVKVWLSMMAAPIVSAHTTLALPPLTLGIVTVVILVRVYAALIGVHNTRRSLLTLLCSAILVPAIFAGVFCTLEALSGADSALGASSITFVLARVLVLNTLSVVIGIGRSGWFSIFGERSRTSLWLSLLIDAFRCAYRLILTLGLAALVLVLFSLIVHARFTYTLLSATGTEWSSLLGNIVVALGYLPNAALFTLAWVLGSEIQLGTVLMNPTGMYSPFTTDANADVSVPPFVLFGALPTSHSGTYLVCALLIFVVVEVIATRRLSLTLSRVMTPLRAFLRLFLTALLFIVGLLLCEWMTTGNMGTVGMFSVAPVGIILGSCVIMALVTLWGIIVPVLINAVARKPLVAVWGVENHEEEATEEIVEEKEEREEIKDEYIEEEIIEENESKEVEPETEERAGVEHTTEQEATEDQGVSSVETQENTSSDEAPTKSSEEEEVD